MNINKICSSDSPKVYKNGRKDRRRNYETETALKDSVFLGNKTKEGIGFFDCYNIYKKSNCPDPASSYTTIKNTEYIKALKIKSKEIGKKILSFEDYKKIAIKRAGILKSNPLLEKILKDGSPINVTAKFDIKFNKFIKITSKKKQVIDLDLDIDYLRIKENTGFVIQTLFGKNINLQNIVFNIENDGIDILIASTKDVLKIQYPKISFQFLVLVIDLEQCTSMLVKINESNIDVASEVYKNRIKTLESCITLNKYFHYDGLYSQDGSGVIELPISKRTIDLRQKNNNW